MKKRTKMIVGIVSLVVIGGIGAGAAASRNDGGVQVRLEPVQERDLVALVSASGWIRPHKKVDVQADIMGRIVQLNVREGDEVTRGQVLMRIDPTQYQAAVARSRAGVSEALAREAQAKANLLQAKRGYERARALASQGENLISKQQVEDAETQYEVQQELLRAAQYGVQMARAGQAEAQDQLDKTVIRAPMNGVITRLEVEEGETAIVGTMNNPGSLLLTVADLTEMEAVIRVDETDVPELKLGDSASVEIDAFPKTKFIGRVTEISHSSTRNPEQVAQQGGTSTQSVDYEIVIRLANPPRTLRSDLSATAEVVTAARRKVLSIPIIALTVRERGNVKALPTDDPKAKEKAEAAERDKSQDEEGVFIIKDGKAHFVQVKTGITGREHFEVLEGLTAKDTVVAGPYEAVRSLEEGKALRALEDKSKKASGTDTTTQGKTK
ncbi:MAG TPA: efflux RND transporter periplasmic adaptor subunit [Longimicrobiales bacterium]|nr:efflux RND transporter periplasmic adaptor subunit [Longimicrobiales bacterium]